MIALPTTPGSQGNLMMPLQIPRSDPQVGALRQMFPDIDAETLVLMLRHHDDNLEATVATLLDLGEDDVGTNDDAAIARALQTEYDAARANVVHRSLSSAENNPVTNGRTAVPGEPGTIVVNSTPTARVPKESAATRARKFLARVASRPGSASKLPRETATRLLEAGEASNSSSSNYAVDDMAPLVIPPTPYMPPSVVMMPEGPPSLSRRSRSNSVSFEDQADPFRTLSRESSVEENVAPNESARESAAAEPSERYSARMSRARAANSAKRVQVQPLLAPESIDVTDRV